jgi:hypothetical protein
MIVALGVVDRCFADAANLVANGSFESSKNSAGTPDHWSATGAATVKQRLTLDVGREGGHSARLQCTEFSGDSPNTHAMIAQSGKIGVRKGQWYRIAFWAKGKGIKHGAVELGLRNTRPWGDAGLSDAFTPSPRWQPFEFLFQAREDVPAAASRLQFWFQSTGTLWLDGVVLTESSVGRQWFPQIATEGVKNFLPNSSFECGGANWGSFTYGLKGWGGNLYRLEGVVDAGAARHGAHSLKIALGPKTLPQFYFDYYEPVCEPVRRVLVANRGWFRVKPGEKLTLSAFLRADAEGVAAQLAVVEAPTRMRGKQVTVGTAWQRYEFTFAPAEPFIFIAVGLDLEKSKLATATLWLDAIQLERGARATDYEPRAPVESFVETASLGNIVTTPASGLTLAVQAFNNADSEQTVRGTLQVTDFLDAPAFESRPALKLPPHAGGSATLNGVCKGRRGFFRAHWTTAATSQSLRCAIIEPVGEDVADSPLGFNHAYPWQFLVRLARQAGIVWWRDWSAKWQTVEPEKGRFDWTVADAQIDRVRRLNSEVEVLLPFPSALWNTTAKPELVEQAARSGDYGRAQLQVAFAAKDPRDFGEYAAAVVRHYRGSQPRPVTTYQILNEALYTSYALPQRFGYTLADYLRLLETASRAMKAADPHCRIVMGISSNINNGLSRQFIERGGLRYVDVFDLHMYNPCVPAETFEEEFRSLKELMWAHGGPKPIWITEWGCYADDDPACVPQTVGDATMNRCKWPSERAATENIVKFTAVGFAHGLRKIFFHAGTCGTINNPDAGGVLFEYGGAPRKMYAGVAALTTLFGVPEQCVKAVNRDDLKAYVFRGKDRAVAVAWCGAERKRPFRLAAKVRAYDIMGNEIPPRDAALSDSPIYLLSAAAEAILQSLDR